MRKYFVIAFGFLFCTIRTYGQTLFTYGNETVSVQDFLKAYNKNNPETGSIKNAKEIQEYLDLYIASRLKIKKREPGVMILCHDWQMICKTFVRK